MASDNASIEPTTNVHDVKESSLIEKVESEAVSHSNHSSETLELKDEGKPKDDEARVAEVTESKIEETTSDNKIEDENVQSLDSSAEPEADTQRSAQLEGVELSSSNEAVYEIVVTETKEDENKINERHNEATESEELEIDLVAGLEQEKSGETSVHDMIETASDVADEPDVSRIETPHTREVPRENVISKLKESSTENSETTEVPKEVKDSDLEVPTDEKVQDTELGGSVADASEADEPVKDRPNVSAVDESPVIIGETESDQSMPKEGDAVEKQPEVRDAEMPFSVPSSETEPTLPEASVPPSETEPPVSETEVPPSETEAEKEQPNGPQEATIEAEDKVDEVSIKLDGPQEAAFVDIAKDDKSSRGIQVEGLDLAKKDETVKEVADSLAEPDTVTNEPIKEAQADDIVVSTDQEAAFLDIAKDDESLRGTQVEGLDLNETVKEVADSVAEPDTVTNEPMKAAQADNIVVSADQEAAFLDIAKGDESLRGIQVEANKDETVKGVSDSVAEPDTVTNEPIKEAQADDIGVSTDQEAAFLDIAKDEESLRGIQVEGLDLAKKDETVKEVADSVAEPDTVTNEPIKEAQADDIIVSTDQEGQITKVASEVLAAVEMEGRSGIQNTSQNRDAEPVAMTTLHHLMKVEGVSEVTKELVEETKVEATVVNNPSSITEQRHGTDSDLDAVAGNELGNSESHACESAELVKEIVNDDLLTPVAPTADVDKPKELIGNNFAVNLEKPVLPNEQPLKVEEHNKLKGNIDKEVAKKEAGEVIVEGEKTAGAVESRDLNSTDAINDAAGEAMKEVTIKTVQRQSNNIISKVKQSIVKVKKVITGKSPSSKSSSSKAEVKVTQ